MKKDIYKITNDDINDIFSIGADWEIYRVKVTGIIDVKFRRKYPEKEIQFNEDGYQYQSIFINPSNLPLATIIRLNKYGYITPYNKLAQIK